MKKTKLELADENHTLRRLIAHILEESRDTDHAFYLYVREQIEDNGMESILAMHKETTGDA